MRLFAHCAIAILSVAAAVAQPLRIESPNGGENLEAGSTTPISWSGSLGGSNDSVRVDYTTDDGASWTTIRSHLKAKQMDWAVPFVSSIRCRVRVTQVNGSGVGYDSVQSFSTPEKRGTNLFFNADGSLLVRWEGGSIDIFNASTGQIIRSFVHPKGLEGRPVIDPTNTRLAHHISVGDSERVEVWNIETGQMELALFAPRMPEHQIYPDLFNDMAFSNDSKRLLVMGRFSSSMWDIDSRTMIDTLNTARDGSIQHHSAVFSPNDSLIYVYTNRKTIEVWDALTLRYLRTVASDITFGSFSADARTFIAKTPSSVTSIRVYNLEPFEKTLEFTQALPFQGDLGRDGRFVVLRKAGDSIFKVHSMQLGYEILSQKLSSTRVIAFAVHPGGDRLVTLMADDRRIVYWRFDNTDSSDNTFTIANTRPLLAVTNMGDGVRKRSSDTTLGSYIINSGVGPMQIESIRVVTGDTADFEVIAGGGPVTIPPGGSHDVGIRFHPEERGVRSAWVEARTSAGKMMGQLTGFGRQGAIQRVGGGLNFDTVQRGAFADRELVIVRNIGDGPLRFDSVVLGGREAYSYTLLQGGDAPFELAPGEEYLLRVRFTPDNFGTFQAGIGVYYEYQQRFFSNFTGVCAGVLAVPDEPVVTGGGTDLGSIQITPNPTTDYLTITYDPAKAAELDFRLVDVMGIPVMNQTHGNRSNGVSSIQLDLRHLPSAIYWLIISHGDQRVVRSIVVQR